ncbi:MAG: glycine cleavage system aminomethyltransferase GcvT [Phaeodactylibacter sp.]|uniref:glycine cleavage system aminomethyltransferase GcvT n=1 Tax=Phaeodactylibacter sp. TaxID=1940289 RepID=UPI0032EE2647
MKTTPLTAVHEALGAKMAAFAGYNMPISYTGLKEEHHQVRNSIGVFDVSHMGEFIIRGREALDLIQKVTTNDASKLKIGDAQYTCLPNDVGGIVDDCIVYRLTEEMCSAGEMAFMMVVNASNIEKDWAWITQANTFDTQLINISGQTALLAVQGPKAIEAMQPLTDTDLSALKFYTFTKDTFAGIENVLISATGYTGSGGFELYVNADRAVELWNTVMETGKPFGIKPIGLGARDTLRLEMGYCLYGNDIDDTTSPIEAGLGWITKTKKGEFISRSTFVKQREEGVSRRLVGFELQAERRVPRHGYPIMDANGATIGQVTSGTLSPSLGYPIGMGYVEEAYKAPGTQIFVQAGRKNLTATVVRPPFYKASAGK